MKIKHILINLAVAITFPAMAMAQSSKDIGLICLNPYISETEGLGKKATSMLTTKLQQLQVCNHYLQSSHTSFCHCQMDHDGYQSAGRRSEASAICADNSQSSCPTLP